MDVSVWTISQDAQSGDEIFPRSVLCTCSTIINNESKGCWQWEENRKGDKYLSKMPFQGFCKIHNSNQRIFLHSSSIKL